MRNYKVKAYTFYAYIGGERNVLYKGEVSGYKQGASG